MSQTMSIAVDPVTRIEGHLKAEVKVEDGKVVDARLTGGMYRGFETIMKGRDPRDASPDNPAHLRRMPRVPCPGVQHGAGEDRRDHGAA